MNDLFQRTTTKVTATYPHMVAVEELGPPGLTLTDLYIRYGANFYVFTYLSGGVKKHAFIDTGYAKHKDNILPILKQNNIDIKQIEYIVLTHRHSDHCGLSPFLAAAASAKVIAHAGFKPFVDGPVSSEDKIWLRGFEPHLLNTCDIEYRDPKDSQTTVDISGTSWVLLGDPILLGDAGRLEILACPEGDPTHTPDQVIVRFTPAKGQSDRLPTDTILFTGDLWLMQGPITEKNLRHMKQGIAMSLQMLKSLKSMRKHPRRDPRLQDSQAKEALKYGFVLVRVKPGHGSDFIGTRFIPKALLADRDLLIKLGYGMDEAKSLLTRKRHAEELAQIHEAAFQNFISEIDLWKSLGYQDEQVVQLLAQIYYEQKGGGRLAAQDRLERRQRMKDILDRMRQDTTIADHRRQIAADALAAVQQIA